MIVFFNEKLKNKKYAVKSRAEKTIYSSLFTIKK